jgi:hypothetical protein
MSSSKKVAAPSSSLFKVSQSKVTTWRRCRMAYNYAHVQKIAPKKKSRPLKFGSIIHAMLEADINGKNPFKVLSTLVKRDEKLFDAEREMYGNIEKDVSYIMRSYFEYWDSKPEQLDYIKVGKSTSEHPFEIEIVPGILAKGKIDALAKAKKLKWLVEHKSHKTFPAPEHRWRNLQSVIYIHITNLMGWGTLDGTVWDYIRSKPPTRPAILKAGTLSRAALDSLPLVVLDTLKEAKLKPEDYKDVIEQQRANQSSWFQRVFTPVSKQIIKPILDDFIATSREMADLSDTHKERTFGRHCEWCQYRVLCGAVLQGQDEEFIKEREFGPNDYETETETTFD